MWVLWDRIKARCSAAVIFDFMEAYFHFPNPCAAKMKLVDLAVPY